MRIENHPILGKRPNRRVVNIHVDGQLVQAYDGEPIAAALAAADIWRLRFTTSRGKPRGLFCAIGQCADCAMVVNGIPNTRTCVTPAREGTIVETQRGPGVRSRLEDR